jgi:chromatin remodeling complex protein RSC6
MSSNTSSAANIMSSTASKTAAPKAAAAKKTTPAASTAAPVPVPVAAEVVAPKATKAAKKEVAATVAAPAPVVVAPVVATTATATTETAAAAAAVAEDDIGAQLTTQINSLHEQLTAQKAAFAATAASLKVIEKLAARLIKKAGRKGKSKSKPVDGAPAKPCVFTEPTTVSVELGAFLGLAKGSLISRSNVTSGIVNYAKSHNLMNKQAINTDAALRKLLGVTEADNLTILNLQKYLSKHYVKATPIAA